MQHAEGTMYLVRHHQLHRVLLQYCSMVQNPIAGNQAEWIHSQYSLDTSQQQVKLFFLQTLRSTKQTMLYGIQVVYTQHQHHVYPSDHRIQYPRCYQYKLPLFLPVSVELSL